MMSVANTLSFAHSGKFTVHIFSIKGGWFVSTILLPAGPDVRVSGTALRPSSVEFVFIILFLGAS